MLTFANARTYHYSIRACKLVKSGGIRLALVIGTTLFVGDIKNVEVVVINAVPSKNIGDEFEY